MLMDNQIDILKSLLDNSELANQKIVAPHNHASFINYILHLELDQEIEFLRTELNSPETFKEKFKARCIERETSSNGIPFSVAPQSITNELYVKLAMSIFDIKTQRELLAIILPSVTTQLHIDVPDTLSKKITSPTEFNQNFALSFHTDDYHDNSNLDIKILSHIVVSDHVLFDLREINKFPLVIHEKIYDYLQENHPVLASRVYSHNFPLQTLADDVLILQNKGTTPKVAIERLIKGMVLGGQRMSSTADGFAGKSADDAVKQFFKYFKKLPTHLQNDLRAITGNGEILGKIFDNEIDKGHCVESSADNLQKLLAANATHSLLINPPQLTNDDLANLKVKYSTHKTLSTEKISDFSKHTLPSDLVKKSLQQIKPNTPEELIVLILNFSVNHYDDLLKYADFSKIHDLIKLSMEMMKQDFFNAEQKNCLLKAIIENYERLKKNSKPLLAWAVETEDAAILKMALTSFSDPAILLSAIRVDHYAYYGKTVLHRVIQHPTLFNTILEFLPEADRLRAVQFKNNYGDTVLHCAARNPESLKAILAFLPEPDRLIAVQLKNADGNTVLYLVADNPESFKTVLGMLAFIPKNQRLSVIQVTSGLGNTILLRAAHAREPESLKAILEFLPEPDRLIAVQLKNSHGYTVLHWVADNPESLKTVLSMLSFIPKNQRLSVIQVTNECEETILQRAACNPESLKAVLEFLPEADRLIAIKLKNRDGNSVPHLVAHNPELLKIILDMWQFIPKTERLTEARVTNKYEETILHRAARNPESLKAILAFLPETHRLIAVQLKDRNGNTVLHLDTKHPKSFKAVLDMLQFIPNTKRFSIVQTTNIDGATVLYHATRDLESFKAILEFLPKTDWAAIFHAVEKNNTFLHKVQYNLELLKAILGHLPVAIHFDVVKVIISSQSDGEKIKLLNDIFLSKKKPEPLTVKSSEKDRIISHINNYLDKFKLPYKLINDITLAKIIAFIQLKNQLNNLSNENTLTSILQQWKNKKSFAYPNQSNSELVSSVDYPDDSIRFFGNASSNGKSASLTLLEKILHAGLEKSTAPKKK